MNKNKRKNYKFYYIAGSIVSFVFAFIFVLSITLPLALKDFPTYLGIISIIVCLIAFVGIIFGIYLLKKGNFLRLNNAEIDQNLKVSEKIKEKYKEHHKFDNED